MYQVFLAPLDFFGSLKMAFDVKGTVPLDVNEDQFTKISMKKLSITKLGEYHLAEREGAIVMFFEVF